MAFAVYNPRGVSGPSPSPCPCLCLCASNRLISTATPTLGISAPLLNIVVKSQQKRASGRRWAFWKERPSSVEMEAISTEEQLDQLLAQPHPIIIDWMAKWCRKCIYLKPKLEKLAAEFYTKVKFYYVDVNDVPQALVKRGGISKMPTIQMWKNGEMKGEVIGGHKAWLVVDEVRDMIKKH